MPISYVNTIDCFDIVPALAGEREGSALLEAILAQSLLDASRLIESELLTPVDYFNSSGDEASIKTVYSDGSRTIRLPPYTEIVDIKDRNGDIVDAGFYRLNEFNAYDPRTYYLRWEFSSCGYGAGNYSWLHYSPITVTAKWGFPCIPPDIVMAVKNMGCLMFLNNPQASVGLEDTLSANQEQRLRNTYTKVLNMWTDKFHHRQLGLG
jgi:hypothetical protein